MLRCNVGGEETGTLLHFEFGNTVIFWLSIWGGPQAHHLRGTQAHCTQAQAHKHISSSYTATIRHYKWPHQLIIQTSTTPCHRTVRHHCSAMQWFPLPQSDHSPDITNASSQLSKDLLPLLFQPPKNLTPSASPKREPGTEGNIGLSGDKISTQNLNLNSGYR